MKIKLVIFDRDGVLNRDSKDFIKSPDEMQLLSGVAESVVKLHQAGIRIAVATNQSAVGRGIITPEMLHKIHEKLQIAIAEAGDGREKYIERIFYCTDTPENATYFRKPEPGMLKEAMQVFDAMPEETVMIGDSLRDLQAAARAGCGRILVRTGNGMATEKNGLPQDIKPVKIFDSISPAVSAIVDL